MVPSAATLLIIANFKGGCFYNHRIDISYRAICKTAKS